MHFTTQFAPWMTPNIWKWVPLHSSGFKTGTTRRIFAGCPSPSWAEGSWRSWGEVLGWETGIHGEYDHPDDSSNHLFHGLGSSGWKGNRDQLHKRVLESNGSKCRSENTYQWRLGSSISCQELMALRLWFKVEYLELESGQYLGISRTGPSRSV